MTSSLSNRLNETSVLTAETLSAFLRRYYDANFPELFKAMEYATEPGGKRVRPFLVLEFCRVFGGTDSAAIYFACAVEAIHSYSLIHDDLPCMDNDLVRRGKPSCHISFGEAGALLAGDALLTAAFELAASSDGISAAARLEGISALARQSGASGMIGGQQLDLKGSEIRLDFDKLTLMNSLKTGALIQASCELGCIAAGAGEKERRAAGEFGRCIGLAFQLTDDLIDMGTEDGKTTYLTYLSEAQARDYAKALTDEAAAAISEYDKYGILRDFCYFIRDRKK